MNLTSKKIFVAGHNGMVGSSLVRKLKQLKIKKIFYINKNKLNLCNFDKTNNFIKKNKPDIIINCAGKVGGILFNTKHPADSLEVNSLIQLNLIKSAYINNIKHFIYLGSSCIYPKDSIQPIKESYLLTGKPEPTNEAYAIAKILGLKTCEYYNTQFNTNYLTLMPCNLYGPNDSFDLQNSHFIPAFIRKYIEAEKKNKDYIEVWGSGRVKREIMHVDDLSSSIIFIMKKLFAKDKKLFKIIKKQSYFNVGTNTDFTIKEYAEKIGNLFKKKIKIRFNKKYPDGIKQKLLDTSVIKKLGWKPKISMNDGIKSTIEWYKKNH